MKHAIAASGRMRFAGPLGVPCVPLALTPAGFYAPLTSVQQPLVGPPITPADGVTYYYRAGIAPPSVPTPGFNANAMHFPAQPPPAWYLRTDAAGLPNSTADFFTAGLTNTVRLIIVGDGQLTMYFGGSSYPDGLLRAGCVIWVDRDNPNVGDNPSPVYSKIPVNSAYTTGDSATVGLVGASSGRCIHIVDIETRNGHFFGYGGALWDPDYDPEDPPGDEVETFAMRGSAVSA